jgi:hypothetical protein
MKHTYKINTKTKFFTSDNMQVFFDRQKGWQVRPTNKALGQYLAIEWL